MKSEEFINQVEQYISKPETKNKIVEYLTSIDTFKSIDQLFYLLDIFFKFSETSYLTAEHTHSLIRSFLTKNPKKGEELRQRLITFLTDLPAETNTRQFTYIVNSGYTTTDYEFILTKYDVQEICYSRLKEYTRQGNDIKIAYELLYQCWEGIDNATREVKLLDQALKIMNEYIRQNPCDFLENLIRPYSWPISGKNSMQSFTLEPFTLQIFRSWENFDSFIYSLKTSKCSKTQLRDVTKFYEVFKINGHKPINLWENQFSEYGIDILKWK